MNKNSIYAFYGSLRRGMDNYDRYKNDLEYLFSARLKGYKLFSKGQYPCAVKASGHDAISVEIFRITNGTIEKVIHAMEMEEGYFFEDVIIDGETVGIYLFESAGNYQEVKGGDWVTFFRQSSH